MRWKKIGHIYGPDGSLTWAKHSALTPTPILLDETTIRVYAGFRDQEGVSRIGCVDLSADDPMTVVNISREPVLDVGRPGTFDDNGVILGDVLRVGATLRMYYVGFQRADKVKFLAYSGLAVSTDGGITFNRYSEVPILDRTDSELYIRAVHTVLFDGRNYRAWIAGGSSWEWIGGKPFPKYDIRTLESPDGIQFGSISRPCVSCRGEEYRIGRPRVRREASKYTMLYTWGSVGGAYLPGYAESENGLDWVRKDAELGIGPSREGWDSQHLSYPSLLDYHDRTYMFYNGNDMGRTGFGYAVLEK